VNARDAFDVRVGQDSAPAAGRLAIVASVNEQCLPAARKCQLPAKTS
jgi:hypothetical protein